MKYVAVVFGLIAGLAQAQDQTVEGAQKFIAGIAEEGGMTLTMFGNSVNKSIQVNDSGDHKVFSKTFPPDKVSRTEAANPCKTNFYVDLNSPTSSIDYTWRGVIFPTFTTPGRNYSEQKSETVYHPQSKSGTRTSYVHEIDWAKVPAVEKSYGTNISMVDGEGFEVKIIVRSNDYATRLHYAMEFLRIKCDKKSATGF